MKYDHITFILINLIVPFVVSIPLIFRKKVSHKSNYDINNDISYHIISHYNVATSNQKENKEKK